MASKLNSLHRPVFSRRLAIRSLKELEPLGIDAELSGQLKELERGGYSEEVVAITWLSIFIDIDEGRSVCRQVRRLVHKA